MLFFSSSYFNFILWIVFGFFYHFFLIPFDFGIIFFFLQNFVSTGSGVNVNYLGWWIFQIGLSVARQLFDLYCLFLFWLLFGMYNCILLFFYLSPADKNGAPHNSIKGLFLPSFIFVFLHTKIVTCVLGYYLTNSPLSLSLSLSTATSFSLLNSSVPFNLTHTLVWNIFYFESIMFDKMLERKLINYISILMTLYFILICYVFFFGNRNN